LSQDVPLAFRESAFTFEAEEFVRHLARGRTDATGRYDDGIGVPAVRFPSELVCSRRKQVAVYEWAIELAEATSHQTLAAVEHGDAAARKIVANASE
jgi:hypothetical protein